MSFLNTILDVVFPVNCLSCGESGSYFCVGCISLSPAAEREIAKWIFPIFDYRHPPIKKALWMLKYKGKKRIAKTFADNMYGRILEELSELSVMENFRDAILIPIPLSKKRHRERGYNQVELICENLVELDGGANFKFEKNILIKPKETEHQAHIKDRHDRLKNLIGSFAVKHTDASVLQNGNIILIDDIATTGATLHEAKKTLKQKGARRVIAFTVAH